MRRRGSAIDAAVWVLQDEYPRSLRTSEIAYLAAKRGYWSHGTQTPAQTMDARISVYIKKGGNLIERTEPGLFRYVPQIALFPISEAEKKNVSGPQKAFHHKYLCRVHALLRIAEYLQRERKRDQTAPATAEIKAVLSSAVVLTVTAWECFVEDTIRVAVTYLLKGLPDHKRLPNELKQSITNSFSHKDQETFWHDTAKGHTSMVEHFLNKRLKEFHNPNTEETSKLFRNCLGISGIPGVWVRQKGGPIIPNEKLDKCVLERHEIVHSLTLIKTIRNPNRTIKFIESLVRRTADYVSKHVRDLVQRAKDGSTGNTNSEDTS